MKFSLSNTLILASLITPGAFVLNTSIPEAPYGDDAPLNPVDVQNFAARDILRIQGNVARALARKSPYIDIMEGGTIAAGMSDVVRAIVQERAVSNQSLVRPAFANDIDMAGHTGEGADVGSTSYNYQLQTLRGMGPLVNVKQARNAFQGTYTAAEDSLKKAIMQTVNADCRATLVDRSGLKMVVNSTVVATSGFFGIIDGGSQVIDQPFPRFLPNAPINFKTLEQVSIYMREDLLVDGFEGTQTEPLLKFIGSQQINTLLRDELGIKQDNQYLTAGSFEIGKNSLTRYRWEGPYRGYAFATDAQPLRYSSVDLNGQPIFIEPEVAQNTSRGFAARINPAWARALYEVAIVVGANSFRRLTPDAYTGEGTFKFPNQLNMGELKFQVIMDNAANVWGDYGRHFYQISRAIRPERPHAVCAIAFKRSQADLGLTPVTNMADYSSADSL